MNSVRCLVSGRVQGVGFRYFVRNCALSRGLSGYACNLPDGRVEVLLQGETDAIESILADLRVGPRYARVDDVSVEASVELAALDGFTTS